MEVGLLVGGIRLRENRLRRRRYVREFETCKVEGDSKELGGEGGTMSVQGGGRQRGRKPAV